MGEVANLNNQVESYLYLLIESATMTLQIVPTCMLFIIIYCPGNTCMLINKSLVSLSLVPRPSFLYRGEGEKRAWYTLSAHASKSPRNPGASDSSVKYYVYCPCTERIRYTTRYFMLFQPFICCGRLLVSFFMKTARVDYFCLGEIPGRASSKPKFGRIRRRV